MDCPLSSLPVDGEVVLASEAESIFKEMDSVREFRTRFQRIFGLDG